MIQSEGSVFVSHRVLSLELELVNSQSLGVLQLLDLLHLLVVASDLLVDDHLDTPAGRGGSETSDSVCAAVYYRTAE